VLKLPTLQCPLSALQPIRLSQNLFCSLSARISCSYWLNMLFCPVYSRGGSSAGIGVGLVLHSLLSGVNREIRQYKHDKVAAPPPPTRHPALCRATPATIGEQLISVEEQLVPIGERLVPTLATFQLLNV
jgi:hypothetical protein